MKTNSLLAGLIALPFFAIACSSTPDAGKATDDVTGDCKDGATKSCKCEDGSSAEKTCASGSWGSCECGGETTPDKKPEEKPADTKPTCTELTSCDSTSAPGRFTVATGLDIKFDPLSKAQIVDRLRAEVASGSSRARYLAAALAPAQAGEAEAVAVFREALRTNVKMHDTLTRQVSTLGFGSVEAYRVQFPLPSRTSHVMEAPAASTCSPALSVRLAKILVKEEDDDFTNDIIYCSVTAATKTVAEQLTTPKTRALDEGDSQTFAGSEAIVWGKEGPQEVDGDLTISYDCFEVDSDNGYSEFLQKVAAAAKKAGPKIVPKGAAGYVLKGADIVKELADFLPTILALDSDDHLFVARQTIPAAQRMELAKGATWSVRKKGTNVNSDWDWTLTMEAWGCAGTGTSQAPK